MTPTLYSVTVDTEEEWDWDAGWPTGAPSVRNIQQLPQFQDICDRHGAHVTYFTNHAVLNDAAACRTILEIAERPNVEIGMHIHPWNTPPGIGGDPIRARESFLHNYPDDVIEAKLATVYERFRDVGLRPVSFRGGRYSSGPVVQRFLRKNGFVADSSVVPFTTWDDDGAPNYRDRDLGARRLGPSDEASQPLWEVPLTLGFTRRPFAWWHRILALFALPGIRHLRLTGIADRIGLVSRSWLNFETPDGHDMAPFLKLLQQMEQPHICFTMHSSSLIAGGNGYVPNEAARQRVLARVDDTLGRLRTWGDFVPGTMADIANSLEKQHACSRN